MVIWKARKGIIWLKMIPIIPNRVGILYVINAEFGCAFAQGGNPRNKKINN